MPGPKGPDPALIDMVLELKKRNPKFGYGRISMQIHESFGIDISPFSVGRILRKNYHYIPTGDGLSWLTFIGHSADSLWSVDFFRCESIGLKSHWVMIVIDQFSRRIVGFAVHAGDLNGTAVCRMFNTILSGNVPPQYLSSDNDPLFDFHRWQANLSILDIEEIKSVPGMPTSHPFVERAIGTCRREFLDHVLFFNKRDLQRKLVSFQAYHNEERVHSSLALKTPSRKAYPGEGTKQEIASLDKYRWISHAKGLYHLPAAA